MVCFAPRASIALETRPIKLKISKPVLSRIGPRNSTLKHLRNIQKMERSTLKVSQLFVYNSLGMGQTRFYRTSNLDWTSNGHKWIWTLNSSVEGSITWFTDFLIKQTQTSKSNLNMCIFQWSNSNTLFLASNDKISNFKHSLTHH